MQPIVIYIFSFQSAGMSCLLTCDIPMYRIKITFVSKRSFQNFKIFKIKKHYWNDVFWFKNFLNDKIKVSNLARRKFQIVACCHWMCFHAANFDISDFCIYCFIATCMFDLKIVFFPENWLDSKRLNFLKTKMRTPTWKKTETRT